MAQERETIQYYIQRLYDRNLTTMSGGNLSIRAKDAQYVTPSEIDKGNLKADDIMEVKNTGEINGKHRVTSEYQVHKAIYEVNPDMDAVLHSHTSSILGYSTAHQLPNVDLLANVGVKLSGQLGMAKYADPGTKDLADVTVAVLDGTKLVAIEENHGLFIGDKTMEACYDTLEDLDLVCKIERNIKKLGGSPVSLNKADLDGYKANDMLILKKGTFANEGYEEECKLLIELLNRLYKRGISTCKNACFSWRLENNDVLVNPANVDVTTLTPKDLVLIRNGEYSSDKEPHHDVMLHLAIYEDVKINNVITSRPPYVMAYACSDKEYGTRVIAECYGYLRNITKKPFVFGDEANEALRNHFDDYHNTALISNSLCVVTGPYPLKTYDRMEVAESTAEAIIETYPVAEPVTMDQRAVEVIQKNCGIYPEEK